MNRPNSAKEGMVRKVAATASATFAARSLRYTTTPSDTPITMAMASDMATTMACPIASSSTWSQLKAMYSRKLLIYYYHHPFVDCLVTANQDDPEESTTPS
jgi:hypothetical protein